MTLVLETLEEGLLTITLNTSDGRNALSAPVAEALLHSAERASVDPLVRAVLLKGAGSNFCVGGDLREQVDVAAESRSFEENLSAIHRKIETARVIHHMAKPVVAAVRGAAAGA